MKQKIENLFFDLRKLKAQYDVGDIDIELTVSMDEITEAGEAFKEEVNYSGGLESYTCYIKDSGISINLYAKELDLSFLNPNK